MPKTSWDRMFASQRFHLSCLLEKIYHYDFGWNIQKIKKDQLAKIAPHTAKASTSRLLQCTK
jgi:hypothetical protein